MIWHLLRCVHSPEMGEKLVLGSRVQNCIEVKIPSPTEQVLFYFLQGRPTPSLQTNSGTLRFSAQMLDYCSAVWQPLLSISFMHFPMEIILCIYKSFVSKYLYHFIMCLNWFLLVRKKTKHLLQLNWKRKGTCHIQKWPEVKAQMLFQQHAFPPLFKGATFLDCCSLRQHHLVPSGTENPASAHGVPEGSGHPGSGLVGNIPCHPCVPGHAGPNHHTHLADVCRAHRTP